MHVPDADSSFAAASHASAFRADTYTFAPPSTNPRAIISPMPRDPPVTTTTLPLTENSSTFNAPSNSRSDFGK